MKKTAISVCCGLALTALCAGTGLASTFDNRWQQLLEEQRRLNLAKEQSLVLSKELDTKASKGNLLELWKKLASSDADVRLQSAWSVITKVVPDGDIANWDKVGWFKLPEEIPMSFMVIDGLYTALVELHKRQGGDVLAANLLQKFSRSDKGRNVFLRIAPEPVASLLPEIARLGGLYGNWKPDETVGTMPIAQKVSNSITDSDAVALQYQFLDNAGIPQNNGSYAWDRKTGVIYFVGTSTELIFHPLRD